VSHLPVGSGSRSAGKLLRSSGSGRWFDYITPTSPSSQCSASSSARRVRSRAAATRQVPDPGARSHSALLFLVVGLKSLDRPSASDLGPKLLVLSRRVIGHDGMRRVEDELSGTVVLLELDDGRVRIVALRNRGCCGCLRRATSRSTDRRRPRRTGFGGPRRGLSPTGTAVCSCPGIHRHEGIATEPGSAPERQAPPGTAFTASRRRSSKSTAFEARSRV